MKGRYLSYLISLNFLVSIFYCSSQLQQNEKSKIYYPASKGELKEYNYYRITRRDLRTFKKEGIPDSIINKLRKVKKTRDGDLITDRSYFLKDIVEKLGFDDAQTYKKTVLYHAKRYWFIEPEPIIRVAPEYPVWLWRGGIEGLVVVNVEIDTMGNVIATNIAKSVSGLDEYCLKAASQFKFTQGIVDDPVTMWLTIPFTFRLK